MPAHSQTLGRISGIVTDSSGGAIAGANVTVTDVARGIPRNLTTDSSGAYVASNLIPGTYTVHVSYMGFRPYDRQDVALGVAGDVHVDATLQPGEQTQAITVTGEAPAITTTNAQLQGTIEANALSDLPFSGHNYVQLLALLPTFQLKAGSGAGATQDNSNGLRGEFNAYVLDGVPDQMAYFTTSAINGGYPAGGPEQAVQLPTDAIQEFNVIENSKAEFGWVPGAQLDVALKSGTNALHGTAFALGRDTSLMARNAFFNTVTPTAFENYGGTVGGPIKKDKLFFLFGYEGQRYNVGNPRNANVPTTISLATAANPAGSPSSSLPDAINSLLLNHITPNPLSLNLAGCVITPAVKCTPNAGLFSNNTTSTTIPVDFPTFGGTDNGVARMDYHLNDHNNFAAEFFDGDGIAVAPVSSVTQPFWDTPLEVRSSVARAWWTWTPNSTWLNDLRFGWDNSRSTNNPSYDCESQSGAPNYAALGFVGGGTTCGLPTITIAGFTNGTTSGLVAGGATGTNETSGLWRWLDNISYTHGNHIFKFGGEFVLDRLSISLNEDQAKGTINFNNNVTSLNAFSNATALDNFMAGIVTSASLLTGTIPRKFHYPQGAAFAQDDWRILPRLTVNLGLRYEYTAPIHEDSNLIGNFNLGSPTGIIQQGQDGPLYKLDPWAFGPRFGLAWDVTGKSTTVVRAGFNVLYDNPSVQIFITPGAALPTMPTGLPLESGCPTACVNFNTTMPGTITLHSVSISPTPTSLVPWAINTPVLGGYVGSSASCTNAAPCSIGGVVPHLEYPMVLDWNFGIQRAITNSLTLDVSYVGNHGQHLFGFSDINQPAPGPSGTAAENARRPYTVNGEYPWFSTMLEEGLPQISNYDALQATLRMRATHGLTFLATYTWSHTLDDTVGNQGVRPQNSLNPSAEYGNDSYDIPQRFTFGPSYFLPGKPGFAQMLQGWQVTSALSIYSSRPWSPIDSADDLSGTGEGQDRWTLVGTPSDFSGYGKATPIPCFVSPTATGAFAALGANGQHICTVGLPAACLTAAANEQQGPGGTTGTASLMKLGCYMAGNSVMIPPAQGTFGDMSRYELFGVGFWEWDMSIIKSWKINERITTQFRAEFYNVTNATQYATPSATLSAPSTFGQAQSTPDIGANSPIVGTGGPRKIQFGLKFIF